MIDIRDHLPPYKSGIYLFLFKDGQTKFGVAKCLAERMLSREYTTKIVERIQTWPVEESSLYDVETKVRNQFKDNLRKGARDYLLGDFFNEVSLALCTLTATQNIIVEKYIEMPKNINISPLQQIISAYKINLNVI